MKTNKLLRTALVTGLSALLAVGFLPTAQAQTSQQVTSSFSIDSASVNPNTPIAPDTGVATVSLDWTYTISTQGGQLAGAQTTSTTLQWNQPSCTNGNVIITGSLAQTIILVDDSGQPKQSEDGTSTFDVQVTQDAPGEQPIRCTFSGSVLAVADWVGESNTANQPVTIVAEYLGLLSANVPTTIKQAGPQKQIRYDIELTNLGNSRSNVRFNLATEVPGKWNPVPPTEIVLESPAQGGQETTKTVSFLISTPFKNGWNNEETTFQLKILPTSTKDPQKVGQEISVNVLARVRGVYVPGFEPVFMLGAMVGAAMLAARMRRD